MVGSHDLNEGRLECYYFIIAALAGLNFNIFTLFASKFFTAIKTTEISTLGACQRKDEEIGRDCNTA